MHKVGIMTWFQYHNYGTALQVTAMSEILKKMGCYPTVIRYYTKSNVVECARELFFRDFVRKVVRRLKSIGKSQYSTMEREKKFDEFLSNHLRFTDKCETLSDLEALNSTFDYFVCGSDQIWAPSCFDSHYFLDFVSENNKKIAYAPSVGLPKIENDEIKKEMARLCSTFAHLSTREDSGSDIIHDITGREVETVLDPTLLFCKKEWDSFTSKNFNIPTSPYLLVYMLGINGKNWEKIYQIAEKFDLEIKIIPVYKKDFLRRKCIREPIGPAEFLSLIRSADYICTDSFHGMAFSVNFGKQFTVFERFSDNDSLNQNSRIYNLLHILKLDERLNRQNESLVVERLCSFNYSLTNRHLNSCRKESFNYLKGALHVE